MLVFNGSGADLEQGVGVGKSLAATSETAIGGMSVVVASASFGADNVVGVPQYLIPNGYYGYVLVKGLGQVLSPATTAAGIRLIPGAGVSAPAAALTNVSFARNLVLVGGSAALSLADIDCS